MILIKLARNLRNARYANEVILIGRITANAAAAHKCRAKTRI